MVDHAVVIRTNKWNEMVMNFKKLGEGSPIIILHGVFGSSDNWLSVGKALAESHTVYLPDLRNHGDSFHSDTFTYQAMAEDLKHLIEQENIERPVVIGHSMGGKVAMKFAVNYPDLLEKLIVVDISPRAYPPHHEKILEGLKSINLKEIGSRNEANEALAEYVPELGVRQFLLKNLARGQDKQFMWKLNLPVIDEQIENVGEGLEEQLAMSKSTLFIRGGKSNYIKNEDNIVIVGFFPNSEVKTIEGAGHWLHAEQPEAFVEMVREFIRS